MFHTENCSNSGFRKLPQQQQQFVNNFSLVLRGSNLNRITQVLHYLLSTQPQRSQISGQFEIFSNQQCGEAESFTGHETTRPVCGLSAQSHVVHNSGNFVLRQNFTQDNQMGHPCPQTLLIPKVKELSQTNSCDRLDTSSPSMGFSQQYLALLFLQELPTPGIKPSLSQDRRLSQQRGKTEDQIGSSIFTTILPPILLGYEV